jgi:hypothetical protein
VRHLKKAPLFLGAALLVLSSASGSRACGFHDDVSIARGFLNWSYPDALHVIGAISAATQAQRLTHREIPATDPFGSHYRATVKSLEGFAKIVGAGLDETPSLSFSLILLEPMLWTHFDAGSHGLRAQVHVTGPEPDEVVLVSGQDVIFAIANEGLRVGEALKLGLIRAYGPQEKIARFLRLTGT